LPYWLYLWNDQLRFVAGVAVSAARLTEGDDCGQADNRRPSTEEELKCDDGSF
jgi:hypothetical protein